MSDLMKRISALLSVKSIVTISLTAVFCILALRGDVPDMFLQIYSIVIAFYFGTQHQKMLEGVKTKDEDNA